MPYGTSKIYAFIDESGAFGWDLENPDCGSHFVVSAIIVEEENLAELRAGLKTIKQEFFPSSEMKSSSLGNNLDRRRRLLARCRNLPFYIYTCIVDKANLRDWPGMEYKKTFYKYINKQLYNALKTSYPKLTICADKIGTESFMESFAQYIEKHTQRDLFSETDFGFEDSKNEIVIQLADIISGSVRKEFDRTSPQPPFNFTRMYQRKILLVDHFPYAWQDYVNPNPEERREFDDEISRICLEQAAAFLERHSADTDDEDRARVITLRFLLSQMVNNPTEYISTRAILRHLDSFGLDMWSVQGFRNKVIAKMRDENVLITSSPHGYKIPTTEAELYSFIDHGNSIAVPMLSRLMKCRDIIRQKTVGRVDLFNREAYSNLRKYMEAQQQDTLTD